MRRLVDQYNETLLNRYGVISNMNRAHSLSNLIFAGKAAVWNRYFIYINAGVECHCHELPLTMHV